MKTLFTIKLPAVKHRHPMPACRCGVNGDVKYNRSKTKRKFQKELQKEV